MELTRDQLVDGNHERCTWCRKPLWVNGSWQRVKGLDDKYYCTEVHASAPYITTRTHQELSL